MSDVMEDKVEDRIIQWILQSKPKADIEQIRTSDLIEARLLDSMQFLDFVYFLNEVCETDVASKITLEDMRTLPGIVSFVKANSPGGA